jgi:hypothetical protein
MQIEAVLFLKGSPVAIDWHAGTLTSSSTLLIDALLLLEEAYTGTAIGLPGYPPSYSAALGDPSGFMALCYMLSERFPFFVIYDGATL